MRSSLLVNPNRCRVIRYSFSSAVSVRAAVERYRINAISRSGTERNECQCNVSYTRALLQFTIILCAAVLII